MYKNEVYRLLEKLADDDRLWKVIYTLLVTLQQVTGKLPAS